ncbi:MAG: EcsC family protein [Acidimicrobiales bacterium]
MGIGKKYVERKAAERIPTPLLDAAGKALIEGVDRAVANRWDRAIETALEAPGKTPKARAKAITSPIRKKMTALGAAAGATAAAPAVGTGVAMGALVAELGVVALRTTDLVMSIGAAYGHTDATPEERRAWVLAVLAFGDDAAQEFVTLARDMGMTDGRALDIANDAIVGGGAGNMATIDALRRINTALVSQVLKKWGTRRGAATVGKLLPFGIGAAVGGSANWFMIREFGKQADRFFANYDREFVLSMAHPTPDEERAAIEAKSRRS